MKVQENVNAPKESMTCKEIWQVLVGRLSHYADDPFGIVLALPNGSLASYSFCRQRIAANSHGRLCRTNAMRSV
jgi:hypothetical protein